MNTMTLTKVDSAVRHEAADAALLARVTEQVTAFMKANNLRGAIASRAGEHFRLPSQDFHVVVDSAEDMAAWDEAARPYQLAVYNGVRGHPNCAPVSDEEQYLLFRHGNSDALIGGAAPGAVQPILESWNLWVRYYPAGRTVLQAPPTDKDMAPGRVHSFAIKARKGMKPETSACVPHIQVTEPSPDDIREALYKWLRTEPLFKNHRIGPSDVAEPTSLALYLNNPAVGARPLSPLPGAIYEVGHIHEDGGMHVALSANDAWEVLAKGWGEVHPAARWGVNAVLVWAPRDAEELEIVKTIMTAGYRYGIGEVK